MVWSCALKGSLVALVLGGLPVGLRASAVDLQEQEANTPRQERTKPSATLVPMSIQQTLELRRPSSVKISPDGRYIVYVVTQAQLARDSYTATLFIVPANGGTPRLLAEAEHISAVRWMPDGVYVTYLAKMQGLYQAWIVHRDGTARRQLTHHLTGVGTGMDDENIEGRVPFQLSPDGQRALFFARDSVGGTRQAAARYDGPVLYTPNMSADEFTRRPTVTNTSSWDDEPAAAAELWLLDLATRRERRVWVAPGPAPSPFPVEFGWSPDGEKVAIVYEYNGDGWITRRRLALLSPTHWTVHDVLPQLGWTMDPRWDSDGRSLTFHSAGEITDRSQPVTRNDLYRYRLDDARLTRLDAAEVAAANDAATWTGRRTTLAQGMTVYGCVRDRRKVRAVCIQESNDNPPDVIAYKLDTEGELTEPSQILVHVNPEMARISLGEARPFPSRLNTVDTGLSGIILPAGYTPGKRYPLVVMLYNQYSPNLFTGTQEFTSYAPQTFAGHGYVVLVQNLPSDVFEYSRGDFAAARAHEVDGVVQSLRVMLDALVAQGLVDPTRMGIMGWSFGCFYTSYILTHYPTWFRAGAVGDGQNHNPSGYWRENNAWRDQEDRFFGGGPNGPYADRWRDVSPILNVEKIRAPLLMEYSRIFLMGIEMQEMLLEKGKQAELVLYPNESHTFLRPSNRYASMMRHFDWFNFWLLDEEDPASSKAEQYVRWRKLRQLN